MTALPARIEVIKCHTCGTIFAACCDGYQDDDWRKERKKYLDSGCTVTFENREDVQVSSCDHPKIIKRPATPPGQLTLF